MAYGYSNTMATNIREKHDSNPDDPLYALGAICVDHEIVPSVIAEKLGVSKQTVYDWLAGKYSPKADKLADIKALLKTYQKQFKSKE